MTDRFILILRGKSPLANIQNSGRFGASASTFIAETLRRGVAETLHAPEFVRRQLKTFFEFTTSIVALAGVSARTPRLSVSASQRLLNPQTRRTRLMAGAYA